jgi:hypothetical protein
MTGCVMNEEYKKYMAQSHITNRYFSDSIGWDERQVIKRKYADPIWDKAKMKLNGPVRITKSAIKIAEVMKIKMGINLFPAIYKIACKGWDIGGGTFAFSMVDDSGDNVYFSDHAHLYKSMKAEYVWCDDIVGDKCIMRN